MYKNGHTAYEHHKKESQSMAHNDIMKLSIEANTVVQNLLVFQEHQNKEFKKVTILNVETGITIQQSESLKTGSIPFFFLSIHIALQSVHIASQQT